MYRFITNRKDPKKAQNTSEEAPQSSLNQPSSSLKVFFDDIFHCSQTPRKQLRKDPEESLLFVQTRPKEILALTHLHSDTARIHSTIANIPGNSVIDFQAASSNKLLTLSDNGVLCCFGYQTKTKNHSILGNPVKLSVLPLFRQQNQIGNSLSIQGGERGLVCSVSFSYNQDLVARPNEGQGMFCYNFNCVTVNLLRLEPESGKLEKVCKKVLKISSKMSEFNYRVEGDFGGSGVLVLLLLKDSSQCLSFRIVGDPFQAAGEAGEVDLINFASTDFGGCKMADYSFLWRSRELWVVDTQNNVKRFI